MIMNFCLLINLLVKTLVVISFVHVIYFTDGLKNKFHHLDDRILTRKMGAYPFVEVGPGSFKTQYKKLDPEVLTQQYKKLLTIMKTMKKNS